MRDRLVRAQSPTSYPFDSFFIPFTTTLSLNWPYAPGECLLPAAYRKHPSPSSGGATPSASSDAGQSIESALAGNEDDDEILINPVFESHLRNLDNWSLGTAFKDAFPDLVDDVRLRDKDPATL